LTRVSGNVYVIEKNPPEQVAFCEDDATLSIDTIRLPFIPDKLSEQDPDTVAVVVNIVGLPVGFENDTTGFV
jgi:hypothetical protein